MALDPYAPCSCGSGKKFRWCCEPIFKEIGRAHEQDANGQHDSALRILDEVVAAHPGNPQAWGHKAELLYARGRVEEAEAALEKAFAINKDYPYGLLLRAMFRFQEGELPGALLLARRAAEAYDPEAHDYLAQLYAIIAECELRLNRPVAARAAMRRVLHLQPAEERARQQFEAIFGEKSRLPACARHDYTFLSPPAGGDPERRKAWDAALLAVTTPRLGELAKAFQTLAEGAPGDAAAWFDLGLTRAWLGDNAAALEALDRYLELESDDARATAAATLAEVLRCGFGMEDQADYHEYVCAQPFREPQPVEALLQDWSRARRLVPLQPPQEGTFVALLLEMTAAPIVTVGGPAAADGRFAGYLLIAGNLLQVTSPVKEAFDRVRDELRQRLALGLTDLQERRGPAQFQDVVAEALLFPVTGGEQEAKERVLKHTQNYFEEVWVHKPRRSLKGNTPLDAAGHRTLRKNLLGVVQFIQDCAGLGMLAAYDFDRLRRKLGLLGGAAAGATPAPPADGAGAAADIPAMGAAELAALSADTLPVEQLELAWQTAQKLDAQELATRFAEALVARPADAGRPDRFPWYAYLAQRVLQAGDSDRALAYVDAGEKADAEHNEGRRRDDYELRRGQVHVKRKDADAAQEVFRRLIGRAPANLKYRGTAAEAMLSLRQGAKALEFAEEGLAAARKANDRDSEQYLQELAAAAKKQS